MNSAREVRWSQFAEMEPDLCDLKRGLLAISVLGEHAAGHDKGLGESIIWATSQLRGQVHVCRVSQYSGSELNDLAYIVLDLERSYDSSCWRSICAMPRQSHVRSSQVGFNYEAHFQVA